MMARQQRSQQCSDVLDETVDGSRVRKSPRNVTRFASPLLCGYDVALGQARGLAVHDGRGHADRCGGRSQPAKSGLVGYEQLSDAGHLGRTAVLLGYPVDVHRVQVRINTRSHVSGHRGVDRNHGVGGAAVSKRMANTADVPCPPGFGARRTCRPLKPHVVTPPPSGL